VKVKAESIKKILIIRLSSLGDIILTTPLLKLAAELFPDAEIDYLTKKAFAGILENNPNISKIIQADDEIDFSSLRELKKKLRLNSYDLVLDAHNSLRSFYLRQFLAGHKLIFRKYSFRKFLLVKFKFNMMRDLPPVSKRYCNMLSGIAGGNNNNPLKLELTGSEEASNSALRILQNNGINDLTKLVVVVPSATHYTKTYPPESYIQVINGLIKEGYNVVLTGKGKDKANINVITMGSNGAVIDLCDKLNLLELTEVMRMSTLVIGGDTGPMHIAEALNKPLIMLAGSSVREFGFYPQNEKAVVLENNSLKCRPCSHIGRSECPLRHFKCMKEISPDVVYREAISLLR
jgi:lipopolysaccharide heptosyltransferase II